MNHSIEKSPEASSVENQNWQRPHYEVTPGKEAYELRVHLPGVTKEQAEITIENDQLLVVGRRESLKPANAKTVHEEVKSGDYRLQLQLNVNIDPERITAETKDGILSVALPIAEESKPRTISVD